MNNRQKQKQKQKTSYNVTLMATSFLTPSIPISSSRAILLEFPSPADLHQPLVLGLFFQEVLVLCILLSLIRRSNSSPDACTCSHESHQHKYTARGLDHPVHKIHSQGTFLGAREKQNIIGPHLSMFLKYLPQLKFSQIL